MHKIESPIDQQPHTPDHRFPTRRAINLVLRWMLGLTLVATSIGKALDLPGFHDVLETYDLWPGWSLWGIALVMPVVELGIALAMLTGRRLYQGIIASLVLHSSFAIVLTLEILRGVDLKNCGCFGVFLARPLTWITPLEDVAMVAITLGILITLPAARRLGAPRPIVS